MKLAPIALFVYNRPEHTEKTLEALSKNIFADQSILYIFADGPKDNTTSEDLEKVYLTRELLKNKQWCKEVIIKESETNLGLANSIILGVTELINNYGSIIVLEDDILAGQGFLKYMNEALALYMNEEKVGCIHAWNYALENTLISGSTFFLRGGDCWGWGTWERAWNLFNSNGTELLDVIKEKGLEYQFNRNGTHKFVDMLERQTLGLNNSWAIRWHASLFLAGQYCLHPVKPIVKNIGLDNSGTHCGIDNLKQEPVEFIDLTLIPVTEELVFFKEFAETQQKNNLTSWQKSKSFLKRLYLQYC
jgi:hypothetical protein